MSQRLTTEDFIKKAKEVHGDKYDYSLVEYVNTNTKVKIICAEHGIFEQTPSHHLKGQRCSKCVRVNKTTEDFIKEAKEIHGDKYDLSGFIYTGSQKKGKAICKIHGTFFITASNLQQGGGCKKCGIEQTKRAHLNDSDNILKKITQIQKKYPDRDLDFSNFKYINLETKSEVICNKTNSMGEKHGTYFTTPSILLKGSGCPKCIGRNKTTDIVISEIKKVHGNSILLDKFIYTGSNEKSIFGCKEHGYYERVVSEILAGRFCPKCIRAQYKNKEEYTKYIDEIRPNYYLWDKFLFKKNNDKVIVGCNKNVLHGYFETTRLKIDKSDYTCPICIKNNKILKTTKEFIKDAILLHGDKYDYSLSDYKGVDNKLKIICNIHGIFEQTPYAHLKGSGCPKCVGKGIEYLPFNEAREFVRNLGFKTKKEWDDYCKSGLKPDNIPSDPASYYSKNGIENN